MVPGGATSHAITLLALVVTLLGALSTAAAYRARGHVAAGLFLDPYCRYSAVSLPGAPATPLRFPDRLVAIDGAPAARCASHDPLPSLAVDRSLRALHAAGAREVTLDFARGAERIRVRRALTSTSTREFVWFWALYFLAGLVVAWSGMVALAVSRTAAARAYALSALSTFLFLASFFDYHTARRLVPVFAAGTVWTGTGCLLLAIHFPTSLPGWPGARATTLGLVALSGALSLALALGPWLGVDLTALRMSVGLYAPAAATALLVAVVARRRADLEHVRWQVRVALAGMLVTLAAIATGVSATMLTGSTAIHAVMPLVIPLTPLSVGWAIVRHNVLDADLVVTRRLLALPTASLALGFGLAAWLALRISGPGEDVRLLPYLAAALVFVAFVALTRRALDALVFPATRAFRPTIEQLAEHLTDLRDREAVRDALERTVTRWLPSGRVRLVDPSSLDAIDHLPPEAAARLAVGVRVWTDAPARERHLLVPLRSHRTLRGVLDIAPKREGALFTEEDLSLLETIASLGAIALHNAEALDALERARRVEVDDTREDKRLTLGVLGAELSHEIAHPLQFFRGLVRRGARAALDPDDVEIGEEELARLERMLASLRTLHAPEQRTVSVALAEPVHRALTLLRDAMAQKDVTWELAVPDDVAVLADPDGLVQVFANLLRNAVHAVPRGGRVGVTARTSPDGGLTVDVWDDGPGVPEHLVPTLFHRWVTSRTHEGGSGLGLSVAQTLVNNRGWRIEYAREEGRTVFRVTVPPTGRARAEAPQETHPDARPRHR